MTRTALLLAAATAALAAASPALARPMTATDMHMMRRVGAPEVLPDGKWAVFTLSATDMAKNKRINTLHMLDLTTAGARPRPVSGAEKGHSAAFGRDGAIYFLMPSGERDQLFRMTIGGAPTKMSDFGVDIAGFKLAPSGDRVAVWADRPLVCPEISCASATMPAKPEGSGRTYDELFVRHWDKWVEPGTRSSLFGYAITGGKLTGQGQRLTGALVGDTPSKPFGGGEEVAFSAGGRCFLHCARRGGWKRPRPISISSPRRAMAAPRRSI